jgi:phosphoribosylformimino-5-aminoimidazole carboxamide ribotide isomerase
MQVIPAIDLMGGEVVRLSRGDPSTAKVYAQWGTPVQVAMKWKSQGAKRLHIIDLDAAFSKGDNTSVVADVVRASGLPVQVGGGIRTVAAVKKLLRLGVSHVILGALAFSNPEAVPQIQKKFGSDSVIVALDNKAGKVMVEGWRTETAFTMTEAMGKFAKLGARNFLITSITKDGMLQGPDLESFREAAEYPDVEIIAAGGVSSIDDLVALKKVGVKGAVVGKALYEGRFTLKEAIATVEAN